jgi:hypothetical protein
MSRSAIVPFYVDLDSEVYTELIDEIVDILVRTPGVFGVYVGPSPEERSLEELEAVLEYK